MSEQRQRSARMQGYFVVRLVHLATCLLTVAVLGVRANAGTEYPTGADRESTIKAGMVLNFMRFTEWPDDAFVDASSPLVVTVIGKGEMGDQLVHIMTNQRVHDRPIEVRRLELSVAPEATPASGATPGATSDRGNESEPKADDEVASGKGEVTPHPTSETQAEPAGGSATQTAAAFDSTTESDPAAAATEGTQSVAAALRASHVLFICEPDSDGLGSLLSQVKEHDVLTVSDMDRFAEKGGMLGLVIRRGRIAFDANAERIDATSLKVSSQLLRLAHIVKTKEP